MQTDKMLRLPEVKDAVGLTASSIWELEQKGDFPRRRKLTKRAVGWLQSEVLAWMKERPVSHAK